MNNAASVLNVGIWNPAHFPKVVLVNRIIHGAIIIPTKEAAPTELVCCFFSISLAISLEAGRQIIIITEIINRVPPTGCDIDPTIIKNMVTAKPTARALKTP